MWLSGCSSTRWGCESVPLLGQSSGTPIHGSACHTFCLRGAGLCSLQVFLPFWSDGAVAVSQAMAHLPCLGRGHTRLQGSSSESMNQADLYPMEFPGQTPPLTWFCRGAKTLSGDHSGVMGRDSIGQDLSADCCKPLILLSQSNPPPLIPWQFHGVRLEQGSPGSDPQSWGSWMSTWTLFPLEEPKPQGKPLSLALCQTQGRGRGVRVWSACGHPSYPSSAVLLFVVQAVLQLPPCI